MNALVTLDHPADASTDAQQAPTAGPHGAGHSVFSPARQAEFLGSLQLFGNVRLACRAARVSAQTAYRQRRASAALAQAWDAALLAARSHAEATLADRAVNGWEEAVYYHGEEVARRRRYSDRLLLAHLARLDRLEAREEVVAALGALDAMIDGLRDGVDTETAFLNAVRPEPVEGLHLTSSAASKARAGLRQAQSERGFGKSRQNRVPPVPPCRDCGGKCDDPDAVLGPMDCQSFSARCDRMDAARPAGAARPHVLAGNDLTETGRIEALQLEAFEDGVAEWWLLTGEEERVG